MNPSRAIKSALPVGQAIRISLSLSGLRDLKKDLAFAQNVAYRCKATVHKSSVARSEMLRSGFSLQCSVDGANAHPLVSL